MNLLIAHELSHFLRIEILGEGNLFPKTPKSFIIKDEQVIKYNILFINFSLITRNSLSQDIIMKADFLEKIMNKFKLMIQKLITCYKIHKVGIK